MRALWLRRSFPIGNVFELTLFRRRPREVTYMAVHPQVMMRRMQLLLPTARRNSERVLREETNRRVKARRK